MRIEEYFIVGKENRCTRAELSLLMGESDRMVRRHIKTANMRLAKKGMAILSTSHCAGYWLSDSTDEMDAYIAETMHRSNRLRKEAAIVKEARSRKEHKNG